MSNTVVGLVLDPYGYESDFLCVAPVVRSNDDGALSVGAIDGWFPSESRPMAEGDLRFVLKLSEGSQREIAVGETVWVLGSTAHQAVMSNQVDHAIKRVIGGWPVTDRGYRWSIGTRSEFIRQSQAFANQLQRLVKKHLSAGLEPADIGIQIDVFSRLEAVDEIDRLPLLGLIARRDFDDVRYALLREEYNSLGLRGRGFFGSFDRRVKKVARQLDTDVALRTARPFTVVPTVDARHYWANRNALERSRAPIDVRQLETQDLTEILREGTGSVLGPQMIHKIVVFGRDGHVQEKPAAIDKTADRGEDTTRERNVGRR